MTSINNCRVRPYELISPGDVAAKCPAAAPLKWIRAGDIFCALAVALCALIYVRTSVAPPIPTLAGPSDFYGYYHAGEDILHGSSPYRSPAFFYPPLLAFLMVPLALVDYVAARWIWFALSHLFLLGAGWLLWRGLGGGRVALCCIACVWALGGALKETLILGQLGPLLVLLLVAAFTRRGRAQGVFAGLGLALKYFPGIITLPLLLGRRRRALAASAGVALAGVCVPWLVVRVFFAGPKTPTSAHYWMGTPSMFSWSIPSVVLRLLLPITRGAPLPHDWEFGNEAATLHLGPRLEWISVATACAVFAVGVMALAVVCRGRLNGRQIPWAMAGLVALSLAVAPVCWTHYQLLQYPGVAMLLTAGIRGRDWRLSLATAACFALVYQLPERFLIAYHEAHNGWTTASPDTLYFWSTVPPLASLAIFALALVVVRRTPSIATDDSSAFHPPSVLRQLPQAIDRERFHVFLTGDKNMQDQQRLEARPFAAGHVRDQLASGHNWPVVRPHVHKISVALDEAQPGTVNTIDCGVFVLRPKRTSSESE